MENLSILCEKIEAGEKVVMEDGKSRELCKVCKKGYLLEHVTQTRSLLASQKWDFLDCGNLSCKVHKDFKVRYADFVDTQKQEKK